MININDVREYLKDKHWAKIGQIYIMSDGDIILHNADNERTMVFNSFEELKELFDWLDAMDKHYSKTDS